MTDDQKAGICPLCGEPNHCAVATAKPRTKVKECWCFSMPKTLDKSMLDMKQCICRSCWERVNGKR